MPWIGEPWQEQLGVTLGLAQVGGLGRGHGMEEQRAMRVGALSRMAAQGWGLLTRATESLAAKGRASIADPSGHFLSRGTPTTQ